MQGEGYPCSPQGVKVFDQPIRSLAHDGDSWDQVDNIVVTLDDGSQETIWKKGGLLDLEIQQGFLPATWKSTPPRQVSSFDFDMVWESEPHPYGMNRVAVGDLDIDGINELVTWWKENQFAFEAYILIYKCTGDNQYTLFMEEPLQITYPQPHSFVTNLLIDDIDKNGQKELIFTNNCCHFWEFSAPGVYFPYRSAWEFPRAPVDVFITDVDQDSVLEFTYLGANYGYYPPACLRVEEYQSKSQYDSIVNFVEMTDIALGGDSYNLGVGDYDNDGAIDIVVGYSGGFMSSWYDTWIQTFRYSVNALDYFEEHWLIPGIWANSNNPLIADFDSDGQQELYIGGGGGYSSSSSNGCGSAYVWESTGLETGYVAWWDTVSMFGATNDVAFALVDSEPCIINNTTEITIYGSHGRFHLFGYCNGQYQPLWQSELYTGIPFTKRINVADIDQDGKMDFACGEWSPSNKICVWEQASLGIGFTPIVEAPVEFALHPNFPNPFNPSTVLTYELRAASHMALKVYDTAGRLVSTLVDGFTQAGTHRAIFNGEGLASGIYLAKLEAGEFTAVQKLVLLK